MDAPCDATLLRIFIGNDDVFDDQPLYDQIVLRARDMAMAGATVTRGILAFGPGSQEFGVALRFSEDLPVVIDIVDSDEKIKAFMLAVEGMIESALAFTQRVSVARYGRKPQRER
jgi:PII-like signaling protein